ncbi:hypothetical protein [Methyloprofundus sp.]|uniref:hypothetical protein n=1 Tax=Methyloprofundus sp. TaxID=2020875 RepID=UPI003D13CB9C
MQHIYINEIIFITLISLCFFGEVLIEVSDRAGVFYWLLMSPVFFYASILSEKTKTLATGHKTEHLIKYQILFWGSAFFAIILVFLTWHAEMMKAQAAAITIHILLAHTMFLSGIILGFRFYLIGVLLFCTAGLTILMEAHFAIDLLITLPFIWLGLYVEKNHIFPTLAADNELVKEIVEDQDHNRRAGDPK